MKSMKLSQAQPGHHATILQIRGGRGVNSHLAGMGLHIGFEVEIIEPPQGGCGAMLIGIGGSRLMLGHGMAEKIVVRQS